MHYYEVCQSGLNIIRNGQWERNSDLIKDVYFASLQYRPTSLINIFEVSKRIIKRKTNSLKPFFHPHDAAILSHHIPPSHSIEHTVHSKHHIPWVWECPPVSHVALGVGERLTSCCLGARLQCNANLELSPFPSPLISSLNPFLQLSFYFPVINWSQHQRKPQADYATDCHVDTCTQAQENWSITGM